MSNFKTFNYILSLLVIFMYFDLSAQLHIKSNTQFYSNSEIYSKEKNNVFNDNFEGSGKLVLNAEHQNLVATNDSELNSLEVFNVSNFSLDSNLILNGDMTFNLGLIFLEHKIYLKGHVILNDATILNIKNVIKDHNIQNLESTIVNLNNINLLVTTTFASANNSVVTYSNTKQKTLNFKHLTLNLFKDKPNTPPPRC